MEDGIELLYHLNRGGNRTNCKNQVAVEESRSFDRAMISGFSVDPVLLWFDTPFMLLIALLVLGRFTRNMRLERKETQILVLVTYFMCG